jgi:hypothetical protein
MEIWNAKSCIYSSRLHKLIALHFLYGVKKWCVVRYVKHSSSWIWMCWNQGHNDGWMDPKAKHIYKNTKWHSAMHVFHQKAKRSQARAWCCFDLLAYILWCISRSWYSLFSCHCTASCWRKIGGRFSRTNTLTDPQWMQSVPVNLTWWLTKICKR